MNDKQERITTLVAVCVKNKVTPQKTAFADFIIRACASLYAFEKRTSRAYVDVLIQSWRFDRWKSYVMQNVNLSMEEQQAWMTEGAIAK
jgi:hypothetical protein